MGSTSPGYAGGEEIVWTCRESRQLRVMPRVGASRLLLNIPHDGDTMNFIVLMTDDALNEIKQTLKSRNYYIGITGKVNYSASNYMSNLIFAELSS